MILFSNNAPLFQAERGPIPYPALVRSTAKLQRSPSLMAAGKEALRQTRIERSLGRLTSGARSYRLGETRPFLPGGEPFGGLPSLRILRKKPVPHWGLCAASSPAFPCRRAFYRTRAHQVVRLTHSCLGSQGKGWPHSREFLQDSGPPLCSAGQGTFFLHAKRKTNPNVSKKFAELFCRQLVGFFSKGRHSPAAVCKQGIERG